jgi:hypothetical protein
MELVAEIIKELDERDRKLKSAVVNKDCDESSFGMSLALEVTRHAKAAHGPDSGACAVSG